MSRTRPHHRTTLASLSLTLALVLTLSLLGCGDSGRGAEPENTMPEVTPEQAEQALSDAMLVSAVSLLLSLSAEPGETSVSNDDGALSLSWSDDADFASGVGTYTVTMKRYTVPEDDLFASEYHGYVLDGSVTMGSADGVTQRMVFDLHTSHVDPETYPVERLVVEIEGLAEPAPGSDGETITPTGSVEANGRSMDLYELAGAFELN